MSFDFRCVDHGSIAAIIPDTDAAAEWLGENVETEFLPERGLAVYGEPRYSLDIALAMIAEGFTCPGSDQVGALQ